MSGPGYCVRVPIHLPTRDVCKWRTGCDTKSVKRTQTAFEHIHTRTFEKTRHLTRASTRWWSCHCHGILHNMKALLNRIFFLFRLGHNAGSGVKKLRPHRQWVPQSRAEKACVKRYSHRFETGSTRKINVRWFNRILHRKLWFLIDRAVSYLTMTSVKEPIKCYKLQCNMKLDHRATNYHSSLVK